MYVRLFETNDIIHLAAAFALSENFVPVSEKQVVKFTYIPYIMTFVFH